MINVIDGQKSDVTTPLAGAASLVIAFFDSQVAERMASMGLIAIGRLMGMILAAMAIRMFLTGADMQFGRAYNVVLERIARSGRPGTTMFYRMFACMIAWGAVIVAVSATDADAANVDAIPVDQPKPQFPKSELTRSREGWVLVRYTVSADGTVVDPVIDLSSGSDAFNRAAMDAVANWRYETGNAGTSSALLAFVYERKRLFLTKRFVMRNARIHRAIENGDFDAAERRIAAIRDYDELLASELAYSFITEARLAEARGDAVRQLECFRMALLNDGRWVTRETYFDLLYAAVVLELQQRDYASALRDYELLMNSGLGRDRAADLATLVEEVRPLLAGLETAPPPHRFADSLVSIERELRRAGPVTTMPTPAPQRDPAPPPPPPRTR